MILLLVAIGFVIISELILLIFAVLLRKDVVSFIDQPSASILIPARNEAHQIKDTIDSLLNQDTTNSIEILVGNDSSTDNTEEIVKSIAEKDERVRYFEIKETDKRIGGKAGVLDLLMRYAQNEIVLIADADMTYPEGWVDSMNGFIGKSHLVSSFTRVEGKSIWAQWQNQDWILNLSGVKMLSNFGFDLTAIGNNMGFPLASYKMIPGFSKMKGYITEDMELLNQMKEAKVKHRVIFSPQTLGVTKPALNLEAIITQRSRWMSGAFTSPIWLIAGWLLRVLILPFTITLAFLNLELGLLLLLLHWLIQLFIIVIVTKKLKLSIKPIPLFTFDIFYLFLNLVCLFNYLFNNEIVWKGRKYSKKELTLKEL